MSIDILLLCDVTYLKSTWSKSKKKTLFELYRILQISHQLIENVLDWHLWERYEYIEELLKVIKDTINSMEFPIERWVNVNLFTINWNVLQYPSLSKWSVVQPAIKNKNKQSWWTSSQSCSLLKIHLRMWIRLNQLIFPFIVNAKIKSPRYDLGAMKDGEAHVNIFFK